MARDPMRILWRIRNAAVTEARKELAAMLRTEERARLRLAEAQQEVAGEQAAARPEDLSAFVAWLPQARQRISHAQRELMQALHAIVLCRETLGARQAEAEALAKLLQRRETEGRLAQARRDQATMDEVAAEGVRRRLPDDLQA